MGIPWFKMKYLAQKHGIVALSSNYTIYGDMSNRVVYVPREFSPDIEVYSIYECFLRGRHWFTCMVMQRRRGMSCATPSDVGLA